jgi:hypothetical protein
VRARGKEYWIYLPCWIGWAIYNPGKNRLTLQFFFPNNTDNRENGEIDFINGDVPQIIVTAPASVQVTTQKKKKA